MNTRLDVSLESSLPEKVLLAALDLDEQGQSPFSAEALVVAAWQKFPKAFGLRGYAALYPDSNRVLSSIMGARGVGARGWVAKIGQKLYTLTREGRQAALRIGRGLDSPLPEAIVRLSAEQEQLLNAMWAAPAFEKFQQGRKDELTFGEACAFWGVGERVRGPGVDARLDRLRADLGEIERLLRSKDGLLSTGRSVAAEDVGRLRDLDVHLAARFSRHLSLLRARVAPA